MSHSAPTDTTVATYLVSEPLRLTLTLVWWSTQCAFCGRLVGRLLAGLLGVSGGVLAGCPAGMYLKPCYLPAYVPGPPCPQAYAQRTLALALALPLPHPP